MKNQKTIKARDPNWRDMEALRKSGAAGSHRDKKKEMKLGKVKHKGKTMDESIYTNPAGGELSRIGRILMDKSITVKDDALSNVLGRVGDELTRYGEAGGAQSIDELCKRARCNKDQLMKMMKWAQQQKDTSLQKVKDPEPKPEDDEDEKESYTAETTPIGHVDDERHMIRKELYQMATYAKELFQMLEDLPEDSDFPHWWQAKVTKSLQMLSKAKHYLENELAVPENTQEGIEESTLPKSEKVLKLILQDAEKLQAERNDFKKQGYDEDAEMVDAQFKDLLKVAKLVKDGGHLDGLDTALQDIAVDYYDKAGEPLSFAKEGVEEADILDKIKKDIKQGWGATKAQFKDPFNMNAAKDYLDKEDAKELKTDLQDAGYDEKQIKMAYGILNDPRYKQGNMSGALKAIEKIAPGMSEEPAIQNAIRATQEDIDTNEPVKEDADLSDKELADAVFKAIDLADKLDINYAVDKVAEFAEDLYSAVNGVGESVCSECGKARFVALPEEMQKQYESVNEEKQKGVDGKVCWKGYKRMGTKKKGGKTVDNCVKM